jgi:putative MATE family efflux protein
MPEAQSKTSIFKEAFSGSDRDFTEGSIGSAVFLLAVPMIAEMLGESLFAIFDMLFVARLGADSVAVIAITEAFVALIYAVGIGLSIGATATIARRIGEKNEEEAAKTAFHVLVLGLICSVILGIIGYIYAPTFLSLLGADQKTVELGTDYATITLASSFAIVFLFLINAIFRGAGDAAIAMKVLWFANICNIILAPIFIFAFDLGVTGAAIGTTIGRTLGVALAFWFLIRKKGRITIERRHCQFNFSLLWQLFKLSISAIIQFTIGTASWMGLIKIVTKFGNEAVAGYAIGIRIIVFVLLPSMGISNAAATLVGQNLGAGKPERAEQSVWVAAFYNAVFLTSVGVFFLIFAPWLVMLFTNEANVIKYGTDCLRIISLGFFFYAYGMVLESSFNGAGDTLTPTFINIFVFWLFEIPLAYVLANHFGLEEYGVFWAITIAFSSLAVVSGILFKRGKWKLQKV